MDRREQQSLLEHARWLTERAERTAEGFANRAGVVLGAVGIELGVIPRTTTAGRATSVCLLISAALLLGALMPRRTKIPDLRELRDVVTGARQARYTAIEQLIGFHCPPNSYVAQVQRDSIKRGYWFSAGVGVFLVSQVLLVLALGVTK